LVPTNVGWVSKNGWKSNMFSSQVSTWIPSSITKGHTFCETCLLVLIILRTNHLKPCFFKKKNWYPTVVLMSTKARVFNFAYYFSTFNNRLDFR
jgi:hypothetical protein